ncbi:MAG: LysM peptidoglycan-binding domain-containing protein, partial [Bdellovibrionia bacterium]
MHRSKFLPYWVVTTLFISSLAFAAEEVREYVVRPEDSLRDVIQKIYGQDSVLNEIKKANPKLKLSKGPVAGDLLAYPLIIRLPFITKTSDSEGDEPISLGPEVSPVAQAATQPPSREASEKMGTYVVKAGDTLRLISHKIYGNDVIVKRVKELNPHIQFDAQSDAKLIAGTVIKFPTTIFVRKRYLVPRIVEHKVELPVSNSIQS